MNLYPLVVFLLFWQTKTILLELHPVSIEASLTELYLPMILLLASKDKIGTGIFHLCVLWVKSITGKKLVESLNLQIYPPDVSLFPLQQ